MFFLLGVPLNARWRTLGVFGIYTNAGTYHEMAPLAPALPALGTSSAARPALVCGRGRLTRGGGGGWSLYQVRSQSATWCDWLYSQLSFLVPISSPGYSPTLFHSTLSTPYWPCPLLCELSCLPAPLTPPPRSATPPPPPPPRPARCSHDGSISSRPGPPTATVGRSGGQTTALTSTAGASYQSCLSDTVRCPLGQPATVTAACTVRTGLFFVCVLGFEGVSTAR